MLLCRLEVVFFIFYVLSPSLSATQTHSSSTTRLLRFGSPLYFANAEIFAGLLYKRLQVNVTQLKKRKMLTGSRDIPLSTANKGTKEKVKW